MIGVEWSGPTDNGGIGCTSFRRPGRLHETSDRVFESNRLAVRFGPRATDRNHGLAVARSLVVVVVVIVAIVGGVSCGAVGLVNLVVPQLAIGAVLCEQLGVGAALDRPAP